MIPQSSITVSIESFALSSGGVTGDIEIDCCLWGQSDKPLVVILGGISASRWALDGQQQQGWWNQVINDDSRLNLQDYQFLTFEYFSFPQRITNPPLVSTHDQATLLYQIKRKLKLPQFHAVIGSSYGGMVSLAFASQFPQSLQRLVCIAAADRNSVKSQALRQIQRQIIGLGDQYANDSAGQQQFIALARSLAMVGYRGEFEWEQRFQHKQPGKALESVNSYLGYHGNRFAELFSASKYCQLSRSIDFHHVDVSCIEADTLIIGITSDQMVPVEFIHNLGQQLDCPSQTHFIESIYGHDGFLLEAEQIDVIFQTFFSEYNHDYIERNHRCASGY
jgi:homoserine O-acetyltransferase